MNITKEYLSANPNPDAGALAYIASLESVHSVAPEIADKIVQELADQRTNLKLIASENYCSLPTQLAMGNLLTDKYSEGFPYHRFYAGCDNVDAVESRAAQIACEIFGRRLCLCSAPFGSRCQPDRLLGHIEPAHRGSGPGGNRERLIHRTFPGRTGTDCGNVSENQRLLGLDYYSGGHLTHGYRHNVSAQMFDSYTYTVDRETGLLDYDAIEAQAEEIKPLILLAGYSAYPRKIDFKRMRRIADKVGAVLMVDMAHFAGLVAGGVFSGDFDPVAHAHVVTTTTHKTLRGPRGGMILCTEEFAEAVNKGCPMVIGGPAAPYYGRQGGSLYRSGKAGVQGICSQNCR